MYFQLRQVILWPRRGGEPRVVEFEPGLTNVISGASTASPSVSAGTTTKLALELGTLP